VLATSRRPLGVAGEVCWRIPPLADHEATELFVDRARRGYPGWIVGGDDAGPQPARSRLLGDVRARVEAGLGEVAGAEAFAAGEALSLTEGVDYARHGRGSHKRPLSGWASLTETESRVAELAAAHAARRRD
jgi:hypothetical protein